MKRYQLVIAGTVAGAAAVFAFPTHHRHEVLVTPAASGPTPTTSTPTATPSTTTSTPESATGADEQYSYGDLAVRVTATGRKVTDVSLAHLEDDGGRSARIDEYAIPQLEREAIDASSANVDAISGATFTSQAFAQSLASALSKLGLS